jgi:hypothetical protein
MLFCMYMQDVTRVRLGVCAGANKEGADQVLPRGQPVTLGTVSLAPVLGHIDTSTGGAEDDERDRSGSARPSSKSRSKSKGRKEKEGKDKGGKEKGKEKGSKAAESGRPRLTGKQQQEVLGAVQLLLDLAAHLLQEHGERKAIDIESRLITQCCDVRMSKYAPTIICHLQPTTDKQGQVARMVNAVVQDNHS